jgi:hypothetical protein
MTDWGCAKSLKDELQSDDWFSPDTYCNFFKEVTEGPAVYLFLLHKTETYTDALIAYVGMSTCLDQRLASHNILPDLHKPGFWPMRWFKPIAEQNLRGVERDYIRKFDPPWNIVGRKRGVDLQ